MSDSNRRTCSLWVSGLDKVFLNERRRRGVILASFHHDHTVKILAVAPDGRSRQQDLIEVVAAGKLPIRLRVDKLENRFRMDAHNPHLSRSNSKR